MSLRSWKQEFYPTPAENATDSDLEAVEHCIRKWEGLRPKNLRKHGMKRLLDAYGIVSESRSRSVFPVGDTTCALCCRHEYCETCPIFVYNCGVNCGEEFVSFTDKGFAGPMLNTLKRIKKMLLNEEKNS